MIRYALMIILLCFIGGLLTFNVERVETVKEHEWELPESVQDSIQLAQEIGWKVYADYMEIQCETARGVMRVCKVLEHQNSEAEDYITIGYPQHCGCFNNTLYE